MKKFLLMFVGLFVAMAANAADTYQLHSSITGKSNWESVQLTKNGDWYEFTSDKFVSGEFGIMKNNSWIGGGGVNITQANTEYYFDNTKGNSKSTLKGTYTFGYNPTTSKVRMVPFTGTVTTTIGYAVRGTIFYGGSDWTDEAMTEGANGLWTLTKDLVPGTFGLKRVENGSEAEWYGYSAMGTPADNCTAGDNGNIKLTTAGKYTITFNTANSTFTVKLAGNEGGNTGGDDTPSDLDLTVTGSFNEWAKTGTSMTANGNVYTYKIGNIEAGTEFKIKTNEDNWNTSWGGEGDINDPSVTTAILANGVEANAWAGSSVNFQVANALTDATITFTYVEGSDVPCKIVVSGTAVGGGDDPVADEDLVLAGTFNDWNENDEQYLMTQDGNTYTYALGTVEADTKFKVVAFGNWSISWGAEGDPSWTEAQPVALTLNVEANAWQGSGCDFLIPEALTNAVVTFVKSADASEASKITISGTSAINAIEAAEAAAPAEYYNLQGIRVNTPEAGNLYIVKRAGKVSKEIIR